MNFLANTIHEKILSLIIREIQIKTTMRHHLTLARVAIIKKTRDKFQWRLRRKGSPCALLVGMHIGAAIMERVWRFLKKLKIEPPCDSAIQLLGIYPKEMKSVSQRDVFTPMLIAALFTMAKIWKLQLKCSSTGEWIKKMRCTCI